MRVSDRRQSYDQLLAVIRSVRRRWRFRMLLRGFAVVAAVALLAALAAAALMARLEHVPAAAGWVRAGAAIAVVVTAAWFLIRPFLRRVSDQTVALYLEEHEPSLEAAVLSAMEVRGDDAPFLLRSTLEAAIRRCRDIDDGRWIERGGLIRGVAALGALAVVAASLGFLAPESIRRGAAGLFGSPRTAEAAPGPGIDVMPGDATVSRGADASIAARLRNFEAGLVELAVRSTGDSVFDRLPMAAGPDGFGYLLFDLEEDIEYFVEAGGVRSRTFTLKVAELPYARSIELELVYPRYTGLPNRTIAAGGDVAALRGTTVRLKVTPTLTVDGGGIIVEGRGPVRMEPDSAGLLRGEFVVREDGFYHVVMDGPLGESVQASPRYVIDALSDGPPIVSIREPGRDERASPIDEVYVEARAEDDYGVAELALHYAVNGGEERSVELYGGGGSLGDVSAGHTFYLEEYELRPGDLVAYYATASDNDAVAGRKRAMSDIYFIQIRPFSRDYRAAEQSGMPQGGQRGEEDGDLSERQRQIVAATFNLVRDSADHSAAAFREHLNTLALAQERLRDQTRTLASRMVARQVVTDSAFRLISEILPLAAEAMERAAERLRASSPGEALPPEQRALQHLQRAEAVFREVQVSLGQQAGGGGGGGAPNAEDLADLFELELDKLRDQYETVDRGGRQAGSAQEEIDETRDRLDELARRQQREAERRRREALDGRGTAGGAQQREIAEAVEEEARRLERLSRQQNRPELREAARRLEAAAESMRRSAAGPGEDRGALESLRDARRLLDRSRTESLRRDAESAGRRAEDLAREQDRLGGEARRLAGERPGAEQDEAARRLDERREGQVAALDSLQRELRRLAGQAGGEQPEAARRLQDAADGIDRDRTRDRIEFSRRLAQGGAPPDVVRQIEERIGEELDGLSERLRDIGGAFRSGEPDAAEDALDRARDLARGLESVRERTQELRERASGDPRGDRADGANGAGPDASAGGRPGEGGAPGGLQAGAIRQLRREAAERAAEARELRVRLREQGITIAEMDELLRGMEALAEAGLYQDPERLGRVQATLADQAKRLELLLRVRAAGEERARLFMSGAEAVPPEYREMVEAYYRSLSREDGG